MTNQNELEKTLHLLEKEKQLLQDILELEQQIKFVRSSKPPHINPIMYWE